LSFFFPGEFTDSGEFINSAPFFCKLLEFIN
jgi:hypothetical protein